MSGTTNNYEQNIEDSIADLNEMSQRLSTYFQQNEVNSNISQGTDDISLEIDDIYYVVSSYEHLNTKCAKHNANIDKYLQKIRYKKEIINAAYGEYLSTYNENNASIDFLVSETNKVLDALKECKKITSGIPTLVINNNNRSTSYKQALSAMATNSKAIENVYYNYKGKICSYINFINADINAKCKTTKDINEGLSKEPPKHSSKIIHEDIHTKNLDKISNTKSQWEIIYESFKGNTSDKNIKNAIIIGNRIIAAQNSYLAEIAKGNKNISYKSVFESMPNNRRTTSTAQEHSRNAQLSRANNPRPHPVAVSNSSSSTGVIGSQNTNKFYEPNTQSNQAHVNSQNCANSPVQLSVPPRNSSRPHNKR